VISEAKPLAGAPAIPVIRIEPSSGRIVATLGEVWEFRELLFFLVWRDVKVLYKQTAIGAAWAVIQPVLTMLIFTLIFGRFAKIPSDGVPYPVFTYAALLPWMYFAKSLSQSTLSLVINSNLITKVYFPRLMLPMAAMLSGVVDFALSFAVLVGLMLWYGILPNVSVILLPGFVVLMMLTALAVSLWLSAINVRYRDVGQAMPFLIQIWMFASPVAYPTSLVPETWRWLYSVNPMAGVIEGFRWALLGKEAPELLPIVISFLVVSGLLLTGLFFFKRMEDTFADVV
jgi:lipopolysaccharide transport system permease protein